VNELATVNSLNIKALSGERNKGSNCLLGHPDEGIVYLLCCSEADHVLTSRFKRLNPREFLLEVRSQNPEISELEKLNNRKGMPWDLTSCRHPPGSFQGMPDRRSEHAEATLRTKAALCGVVKYVSARRSFPARLGASCLAVLRPPRPRPHAPSGGPRRGHCADCVRHEPEPLHAPALPPRVRGERMLGDSTGREECTTCEPAGDTFRFKVLIGAGGGLCALCIGGGRCAGAGVLRG
jgi:hypothetical protein